jgi:hypothetical protein
MKFDLFTKSILVVIAVFLALNLLANVPLFQSKPVEAAPASFVQVGKTYNFYNDNDHFENGRVTGIESNGWIKISKFYAETNQSGEIYLNTDLYRAAIPLEERR